MQPLYTNQELKAIIKKLDTYLLTGIDSESHDGQSLKLRSVADIKTARRHFYDMLVNQGGIECTKPPIRSMDFNNNDIGGPFNI